jgi:outer membrane immunogenic protein
MWSGLYVGGDIGVFTNTIFLNDFDAFLVGGSRSLVCTNFTAGVQAGYDWEFCNKLLGIVADWNWVNIRNRSPSASVTEFTRNRNNWFTTIRGRAGVTMCDALLYVTVGAVVHNVRAHFASTVTAPGASISICKSIWGWTGGVGVEYLVGCGWSLGAEILSLNFSSRCATTTFTAPGAAAATTYRLGVADIGYVGRFYLNYRLGDFFGI